MRGRRGSGGDGAHSVDEGHLEARQLEPRACQPLPHQLRVEPAVARAQPSHEQLASGRVREREREGESERNNEKGEKGGITHWTVDPSPSRIGGEPRLPHPFDAST